MTVAPRQTFSCRCFTAATPPPPLPWETKCMEFLKVISHVLYVLSFLSLSIHTREVLSTCSVVAGCWWVCKVFLLFLVDGVFKCVFWWVCEREYAVCVLWVGGMMLCCVTRKQMLSKWVSSYGCVIDQACQSLTLHMKRRGKTKIQDF